MAGDEVAQLVYVDWQDIYSVEKPYQIFSSLSSDLSDLSTTNLVFKDGEVETMHDLRDNQSEYTLDKQGFQFCQHSLNLHDVSSEEQIRSSYLPQMEALLRDHVDGVDRVFFFDWRVRATLSLLDRER